MGLQLCVSCPTPHPCSHYFCNCVKLIICGKEIQHKPKSSIAKVRPVTHTLAVF